MEDGLLSLKWNNHCSIFTNEFHNLRKKELYVDATLACEGNFFSVHKLVLSSCSDYFSKIFGATTCKSPVIILKGIRCREIKSLLDFMYKGEVEVRQEQLSEFLETAEYLGIKGLTDHHDTSDTINNKRNQTNSPTPKRRRKNSSGEHESIEHTPTPIPKKYIQQPLIPIDTIKLEETDDIMKHENLTELNSNINSKRKLYEHQQLNKEESELSIFNDTGMQEEWTDDGNSYPLDDGQSSQHMAIMESSHPNLEKKYSPVQCPVCGKWIKQRNNLSAHVRTHTGEKPYACPYCPYRSIQSSALKTHIFVCKKN